MSEENPSKRKRQQPAHNPKSQGSPRRSEEVPPKKTQSNNAKHSATDDKSQTKIGFRRPSAEWSMVVLTGLLLAASILQWQATRETINETRKTFIVGSRAYLVVESCEIQPTEVVDDTHVQTLEKQTGLHKLTARPIIKVVVVNAGETPANNIKGWLSVEVRDDMLKTDETPEPIGDRLSPFDSSSALGKNARETFLGRPSSPLRTDELDAILAQKKYLIAFGVESYTDVFGATRTTRFCSFYEPRLDFMVPCPAHNTVE